jgi:hypothetical protein
MSTTLSFLLGVALAALAFAATAAETTNAPPLIVIYQLPDYPGPDGSRFRAGLVAILWSDGRIVRAVGSTNIGKEYVEGVVSPAQREKFFASLNTNAVVRNPPEDSKVIRLHRAFQIITLRREGKVFKWKRWLPDSESGFHEVEERLWSVPLEAQRPTNAERFGRWIRYE